MSIELFNDKDRIGTFSSSELYFDFIPEVINNYSYPVEEIAHALSNLCRFTGQCKRFYSVAEHSLLVQQLCELQYPHLHADVQLYALFHDASEAYLGEVTKPLKELLPAYKELEARVQHKILQKHSIHVAPYQKDIVKHCDSQACEIERKELMREGIVYPSIQHIEHPALRLPFGRYGNKTVARFFLNKANSLFSRRHQPM